MNTRFLSPCAFQGSCPPVHSVQHGLTLAEREIIGYIDIK